jgi:hypothetical protein
MSFLSRLTKGLATLSDFISGLSKGILSREGGATQQTIKSDAQIKSPEGTFPSTGGKKHRKTPYWAPNKKPVKVKLRTRGVKRFPYAWKARLKARARTKAKTRIHITGVKRATTGFLAQIIGVRSFNVGAKVALNGIKRFVATLYANIFGVKRNRVWHGNRVSGTVRAKIEIREAIRGTKRFNAALNAAVLGTKAIFKSYKVILNGDVKGIITKIFKVTGKRNISKILYALGLLDRVEKKR